MYSRQVELDFIKRDSQPNADLFLYHFANFRMQG